MENHKRVEILFAAKKCIKFIGCVVAVLVFALVSQLIETPGDCGSVLFIYGLLLGWIYLRTKMDFLVIDRNHIKVRKGLIFVENRTIPFEHVASYQVDTLPWMMIFGYGKIYITLSSGEMIKYPHVANYREFLTVMNGITQDSAHRAETVDNNIK